MNKIDMATTLVIVGITGDLSRRKLLPAIREIAQSGAMPDEFKIIGISRRDVDLAEIMPISGDNSFLTSHIEIRQMDLDDIEDYRKLSDYLNEIDAQTSGESQRLYYLSIPPNAAQSVVEFLGQSGLSKVPNTKLLLEKPFGVDLASAEELIKHLKGHFDEDQVYRIDHYLAKEMAQNLVVFRSGNALFKRTWNTDFIESIEIVAAQHIGIEGRAQFYEQTGALRDIIQSHLLQLAALTMMDLPELSDWSVIPEKRLKALTSLRVMGDIEDSVVRGQYRSYRDEVDNPGSQVETFVSVLLESDDPNWRGVPLRLTCGKALDKTTTDIIICYRRDEADESNKLILRIQPNEGAELQLWAKQPGYGKKLRQVALNFSYSDHFTGLPEAYERVFVDAMRGDRSLFTSSDEVLASWRILKPLQDYWANSNGRDIIIYESSSSVDNILGTPK